MSVRAAILQLLDEGPRHGYQLKVDFEARTGDVWPLNVGQVYTTLDRLARDGAVEEVEPSSTERRRPSEEPARGAPPRTYRITEAGRDELKRWLTASPVDGTPPRDELITKVLLAMGRGGTPALEVIDEQRAALFLALQVGRRQQRRREHLAEQLAHDALLTRIEADLGWLDRCEDALRRRPKGSPS